jgi:hypothetical protein
MGGGGSGGGELVVVGVDAGIATDADGCFVGLTDGGVCPTGCTYSETLTTSSTDASVTMGPTGPCDCCAP